MILEPNISLTSSNSLSWKYNHKTSFELVSRDDKFHVYTLKVFHSLCSFCLMLLGSHQIWLMQIISRVQLQDVGERDFHKSLPVLQQSRWKGEWGVWGRADQLFCHVPVKNSRGERTGKKGIRGGDEWNGSVPAAGGYPAETQGLCMAKRGTPGWSL